LRSPAVSLANRNSVTTHSPVLSWLFKLTFRDSIAQKKSLEEMRMSPIYSLVAPPSRLLIEEAKMGGGLCSIEESSIEQSPPPILSTPLNPLDSSVVPPVGFAC